MQLSFMDNYFDAYMAGVADSDGSFTFMKRKRQSTVRGYHYRAIFQLTWKSTPLALEIMNIMKERYGGSISPWIRKANDFHKSSSPCLKYAVEGVGLDRLIESIYPYLRLKKQQAELISQTRKLRATWRTGTRTKPDSIWQREDLFYAAFNQLNTKNFKL